METALNIFICIFEIIIFDEFFKNLMTRKHNSKIYNWVIYLGALSAICFIGSFENTKFNFVGNILIYFVICNLIFEDSLKKKIFYFIVFYTIFAGMEIIFEFAFTLIVGNGYSWYNQSLLSKFLIICLIKLMTFLSLYLICKKMNMKKYDVENKTLLYAFILPISSLSIYGAIFYSNLMFKVSGWNEIILLMGCILLLFSNVIIFVLFDRIFRLNYEKQILEMTALKTDMEKKYYNRMEKVNMEQSKYMHDLKHLLKTIGNLAVHDQNEEIKSVVQNMKIRIGEMEDEIYCRFKVLNTVLCEKKKEALDHKIKYHAYIEPGVKLNFIQDMDMIVIMGNLLDNAIEASKKIINGYIDVSIFETQKGHFLMIRVENKYNGVVKRKGEDFCSTKREATKHGIGLQNVKNCVEKYGGILQINTEKDIFTVSVILTIV